MAYKRENGNNLKLHLIYDKRQRALAVKHKTERGNLHAQKVIIKPL